MNGPFYVETLARNGDVLHRHLVQALPIRIGRGYGNDYIIDDDYVAASHAVVETGEDGTLVMRDLGSRNGIVHKGRRRDALALDGHTVVRLGHTSLRIRDAGFAVAPELLDRTMHRWEGALPGLVGLLLVVLFALFTMWLGDTRDFGVVRYLQAAASGAAAGLLWAGMWAIGNRLFGRHARLGRHLFIVGGALAVATIYDIVSSIVAYAFSLDAIVRYSSHAVIAIGCAMLYFHLRTVKPHHTRGFAAFCGLLLALGSGLTLMSNKQGTGKFADDHYMALLLPPSLRASPDYSVDSLMGDVEALKPRLDRERTEKVRDGDGEDEE